MIWLWLIPAYLLGGLIFLAIWFLLTGDDCYTKTDVLVPMLAWPLLTAYLAFVWACILIATLCYAVQAFWNLPWRR